MLRVGSKRCLIMAAKCDSGHTLSPQRRPGHRLVCCTGGRFGGINRRMLSKQCPSGSRCTNPSKYWNGVCFKFCSARLSLHVGCSPKCHSALSYTVSTAAACSTFNDIHFHDVTVHQDSSLQPSRTSHHKADRVKINKDIRSVFTRRDIRSIPSYPHIKCAKKLSAQTTSPTIDNFVLLLKVTPDYYSKKHCGELNFVDRFPPSQILMIWILLLHEIKIKWNGVKYNIFSVSTNDDNETTMMWLSCVIIQLFPRVLSTPIPDPILHFISKWDSDCVIEFSSLVQAQTRLLLSTSTTITIRLQQ